MVTKHQANVVQNLGKKKFRAKYQCFKVEGDKMVEELLTSGLNITNLYAEESWATEHPGQAVEIVTSAAIKKMSDFQCPPRVLAIAEIPEYEIDPETIRGGLSVLLNGIQDPGNMGTILRICDWFDVTALFLDEASAQPYSPKVVQASMGAIFRRPVIRTDLRPLIETYASDKFPVYGTFLNGENIHHTTLSSQGFILMGSEGRGISAELEPLVTKKITIPQTGTRTTESLNVAVATGIVLAEFRR